jgi:sugar phosphate isomerase/epimerase
MFLSIRDSQTRHVQPDGLVSTHAQTLRALSIDHVEVWLEPDGALRHWQRPDGEPWRVRTPEEAGEFGRELRLHDITPHALCLPTDFAAQTDGEPHVSWASRAVFLAQAMGAQVVRIDTATRDHTLAAEEVLRRFCEAAAQVLLATREAPLPLGIENHGHVSNEPAFLDEIFHRVPDERLGLTLDPGNFYWFGLPLEVVYEVCEHFAPRTRHTHFKNIGYPLEAQAEPRTAGWKYDEFVAPLGRGDLDMARLVAILKRAGYNGDLCIEDESLGRFEASEREQVLAEDAECLRAALAGAST